MSKTRTEWYVKRLTRMQNTFKSNKKTIMLKSSLSVQVGRNKLYHKP